MNYLNQDAYSFGHERTYNTKNLRIWLCGACGNIIKSDSLISSPNTICQCRTPYTLMTQIYPINP